MNRFLSRIRQLLCRRWSPEAETKDVMTIILKCPTARCMIAVLVAGIGPAMLCGQSPKNLTSQEFVDAFVATERAKLIDKIQKQGDSFDPPREAEKLRQKHFKVFGTPLPADLLSEFDRTARETAAIPPDQFNRARDPADKRSPTELSPELFLANAKVKFLEDIREEGARFETTKELSKLSEKFERNFGKPMPRDIQDVVLRTADDARDLIALQRAETAGLLDAAKTKSKSASTSAPSRPRKVAQGARYPDGLPDWFAVADRNQDGQVGLYEWDRSRFEEFAKWDLNGDGLLEPREVLRTARPPTQPGNDKVPGRGSK